MNWQRLARVTVVVGTILMLTSTPALAGLTPATPHDAGITEAQSPTIDSSGTDKQTNTYPSIETKTLQVDESGPTQFNGSALQLDGEFGYATGASDSLILGDKSMTIQAWVKHDGNSEDGAVIVQKGNGYGLHFVGSGEERPVQFQISGSGFNTLNSDQGIVAGQWTHVTATYDGNQMQIYINGKLDASTSEDDSIGSSGGKPLQIGAGASASQKFFSGQIDEVRIWDQSLTKFELQTNPYETLPGAESGLVSYYTFDANTPEQPQALDQAGQNNLDLRATASKESPDALPIAPTTYATPETGTNVTISWDERTGAQGENAADSFRVYRSTTPDSNQQEIASINSGATTYTDTGLSSGETYYYTVTSIVNGEESHYAKSAVVRPYGSRGGASLELDGENDYATLSNRPSKDLNLDSNELTIEMWLKHDGGSDNDATIIRNGNGWRLRFAGSGEERPVYFQVSGSGFDSLTSNSGIPANEWTHLAATYDSNEMKIFINGKLDESRNEDAGISAPNRPVRLGTADGADSNFFSGQIDEVRLWSTARGDAQIRNNYTSELTGNEAGLNGYWRFDSPGASVARGSGRLKGTFELAKDASIVDSGTFPVPDRVYARGNDGTATIRLNERVSGNTEQFHIYRSPTESRTNRNQIAQVSPTANTYTDTDVSNGETYYYEVTTVDDQGQESDYSIPATAVVSQNPPGKSFEFAVEENSFGTVTARPSTFLQDQTLTVEAWIRFNESADEKPTIIRRGNGWRMELLGSGSDRSAAFRYSGSGFDEISSNQGITAGEWTHVAVTYDGNELAMYINGQLDGSLNEDGGIGNGGTADIRLGTGSSANSNFYAGQLDEIRVWDSYRSPEQINNSYDNELLGNESGLVGYWRGCNVAGNDQARGSAVRPMTANLTNVECQSSGVPMEDSSAEDSGILDLGIELQSEAAVSQGSSVDINTFPNNRANQAVSGTLELRVDQNGDSQFSAAETVSSKQVSFDASESRTETLSYTDVQLDAGNYTYQARITSDGQTVTSFTNGTLTVTPSEGPPSSLDFGIELQSEATVSQGSSVDINTFPNNRVNQAVSGTLELRVDQNGDSQFSAAEIVSSKQVSFDASERRTEVLSYNNVQLGAGDYLYQARMSSNGQTVTSFTSGTLTVTTDPPENDTSIDITRTVSSEEAPPGEQVTVTTEITEASGSVSTSSTYEPSAASATVRSVTVNGDSANPILSEATTNGSTVTLGDVGTDATVTITEELTVSEELNVTHQITGEVTAGETTTEVDPVSVTVTDIDPQSPVDEYDANNDGDISIIELGQAGQAFASGELTITELGEVGAAFAS